MLQMACETIWVLIFWRGIEMKEAWLSVKWFLSSAIGFVQHL